MPQHPVTARDRVRYAGEPIAGWPPRRRTRRRTRWRRSWLLTRSSLPSSIRKRLLRRARRAFDTVPSNIAFRFHRAGGDAARAFTQADVVIRRRFANNRVTAAPLEGRAVLSDFNAGSGRLTHHTSSQLLRSCRSLGECLALPLHKLRLVAPDIGGGFGAKLGFYAEDVICALLSMRTGRPCLGRRTQRKLSRDHAWTRPDPICRTRGPARRRIIGLRTRLSPISNLA